MWHVASPSDQPCARTWYLNIKMKEVTALRKRPDCNPSGISCVKWIQQLLIGAAVCSAIFFCASLEADTLSSADDAVRLMRAGDLRGAAVLTNRALNLAPGDTLLYNLAASVLMLSGDSRGASAQWRAAQSENPGDSLSLYGLGLAALHQGDRTEALALFRQARLSGDTAVCLLAERYTEGLATQSGAVVGTALPGAMHLAAKAMNGIGRLRTGEVAQGLKDVSEVLNAKFADPYGEPPALLMTFDASKPLGNGAQELPLGNGLARSRAPKSKSVSGPVVLSPNEPSSEVAFVVFKVDGSVVGMVNSRPYRHIWQTALEPNGVHRIEIVMHDAQGTQTAAVQSQVRTWNPSAPRADGVGAERADSVRSALWQALALQPSRHALAFAAAGATADAAERGRYLRLAAAIAPMEGSTRAHLASLRSVPVAAALWRGSTDEKVVALTFDDGPKPGVTEPLLDVLTREGVTATFFVIGRHTTAFPALTHKLAAAGMQIENHTYTHPNMTVLPARSIAQELMKTEASVMDATGRPMKYFRPPGGNLNPEVSRIAAAWGLAACMWTVDAEAYENGSPDRLVEFVVQRASPGAIILLHNGRMTTVEALPKIIRELRRKGYRFVTIDEMAVAKARKSQALAERSANPPRAVR